MSAIFNTVGEQLTRNANLVAATVDTTILGWARVTAAPVGGQYRTIFTLKNAGYTAWAGLFTINDGTSKLVFSVNNGGGELFDDDEPFVVGQWFNFAYVRTGTSHRYYLNGVLIDTLVSDFALVTWADFNIGSDGVDNSNVDVAYVREYNNRVMTLAEINAELASVTIVSAASIRASYPLQANPNDDSGGGNNLTTVGAVTYVATVPLTNVAPNTAIDIGAVLPYNASQNTVDGGGTAQPVWYKYTAQIGDKVIGGWGFGDLVTYRPVAEVLITNGTVNWQVDESDGADNNKRFLFAVQVGVTYWIVFRPNAGNPTPAVITINVERAPDNAFQVGDIFVPPDVNSPGFAPGTIYHPTSNYTVRQYILPFVLCEGGDILPNGKMLFPDTPNADFLKLYDDDFTLLATTAFVTSSHVVIRSCLGTGRFFAADPAVNGLSVRVSKVDDAGTILQTWTISTTIQPLAIAADNAEAILYFSDFSGGAVAVRRYDLNASAPLSNLVAGIAGTGIRDILVLNDGTILVSYQGVTDEIRRYDATGVLLNTYPTPNHFSDSRLAYAISNDEFWSWYHLNTPEIIGTSRFRRIRISDGAILQSVDQVHYSFGVYSPDATATPLGKFGYGPTCPFVILRGASSTGTIIVNKVTLPADATLFTINTVNLSPASYQLADGDSRTHSGLTPASNYEVSETANALYATVITVSNGSPANAISVAAGETVTVTITNTLISAEGSITVGKVTDPLDLVTEFPFIAGGGLSPTSFILHSEEERLFEHLSPRSGYSVLELVPVGWRVTYLVSNGSSHLNITVGPGENVSVFVLNEMGGPGTGIFEVPPTQPNPPNSPSPQPVPTDTTTDSDGNLIEVKIPNPFWRAGPVRDE